MDFRRADLPNKASKAMGSTNRRRRKRSLLRSQGPICHYCLATFDKDELTLDHVKPYSKGGSNDLSNLVLACSYCNAKKANKEAAKGCFAQGMEEGL